jgi:hypothetical protein
MTPAARKAAASRPATIHRTTFTLGPLDDMENRRFTLQVRSYAGRVERSSDLPEGST